MAKRSRCAPGGGQSSRADPPAPCRGPELADPRAGSPHTANQKARRILGWGGGVKGARVVRSCGKTGLPSALVTWGKEERDGVTHVSIQGKGQASARPECPPRVLLGLTLGLRGPQGPPPPAPTSPGVLPPLLGQGPPPLHPQGPPCLPGEGLGSSVAQGPRPQAGLAAPALGKAHGG